MTASLDRILQESSQLGPDDRAELALKLIESLSTAERAREVEQAWNAEAIHCLAEYDAGETATLSSEDLHADIETKLRSK